MIRILDIVLSATGLILLGPLMLLALLLAWLDNGSPLFAQRRVGQNRQPFILLKFRTMRPGAASVASHLADASAITAPGRRLRRTRIDELPQLWNVLKSVFQCQQDAGFIIVLHLVSLKYEQGWETVTKNEVQSQGRLDTEQCKNLVHSIRSDYAPKEY